MARRVTFVGRLGRIALRKGLFEGSRPWLYTAIAASAVRLIHRVGRQGPETVYSKELEPGERVQIRVIPPPERR